MGIDELGFNTTNPSGRRRQGWRSVPGRLGLIVTEQVDNANPFVAGFASSAVHAAIVNLLLR